MSIDDIISNPPAVSQKQVKGVGRNEPCPCGSGVKYKRCHGVDAPPVLSERKMPQLPPQNFGAGMPGGGFDPSQMDPAMLMQMSQMLQRLPKGQMQRLQTLMQKAMAGKDVTREAQELESLLPSEFVEAMKGFALPGLAPAEAEGEKVSASASETAPAAPVNLSAAEARAIVEQAVKEGKIAPDQVADLLPENAAPQESQKSSFWSRFTGKKK